MVRYFGWLGRTVRLFVVGCVGFGLAPAAGIAGTYEVTQTCGAWQPVNSAPSNLAIYTECPGLVVRNVGGAFSSRPGHEARWEFFAPPGAAVDGAYLAGHMVGLSGWQATILSANGSVLETCPGAACPGGSKNYGNLYGLGGAPGIYLRVRCGADRCPNGEGIKGYLDLRTVKVFVADSTRPGGAITGGNLLDGWRSGVGTVTFDHADNVGIRSDRILVDGSPRGSAGRACTNGLKIPCPNGPASLTLDTTRVSDGVHLLDVESIDSAGNAGGEQTTIRVDNTAPAALTNLQSDAGDGWRATNAFALSWSNPVQAHAPIAGVGWLACPAANEPSNGKGCVRGSTAGSNLSTIPRYAVPGAGAWRVRLWLRDSAGNEDPATGVPATLRFDNTIPRVAFREQDPANPTLLRLDADDSVSGLERAEIEARRQGDDAWRSLPVSRDDQGFRARLDDERLRRGLYELRARVVDYAGNERSTTSRTNGQPAVLKLPVRARTSLIVGRPGRVRCRGRGERRRCLRQLVAHPAVRFGHSTRVVGRLRRGGKPLANARVKVWSRTELPGAPETRVATLRTTKRGLIRYRVRRGPARTLRFRYRGTALLRGDTAKVQVRVRGASTIRPSRHNVVNGEYVTFRGRVQGRPLPAGGKLVELQVYTRRRWRTFAQPRARATSGRWAYQYRFEAIRGTSRFRFRARIRREEGYPFRTGMSRSVRIVVRGL